jgi:hypothetical protein
VIPLGDDPDLPIGVLRVLVGGEDAVVVVLSASSFCRLSLSHISPQSPEMNRLSDRRAKYANALLSPIRSATPRVATSCPSLKVIVMSMPSLRSDRTVLETHQKDKAFNVVLWYNGIDSQIICRR